MELILTPYLSSRRPGEALTRSGPSFNHNHNHDHNHKLQSHPGCSFESHIAPIYDVPACQAGTASNRKPCTCRNEQYPATSARKQNTYYPREDNVEYISWLRIGSASLLESSRLINAILFAHEIVTYRLLILGGGPI